MVMVKKDDELLGKAYAIFIPTLNPEEPLLIESNKIETKRRAY